MKSLDTKKLSLEINKKIKGSSFGIVAKEIGVPKATLYRTSKGSQPDGNNLVKILDWLQMPLKEFEINV